MQLENSRPSSPYPGLRPFTVNESSIFFGRDEQVDGILFRLRRKFVAIVGPSGCGKSSLICAGMLPALQKGYLHDEGTFWSIVKTTPGNQPFTRLARALLQDECFRKAWNASDDNEKELYEQSLLRAELYRGAKSLCEILDITPLDDGTKLLVVIDQFEELIRFSQENENNAAAFVDFLLESSQHKNIYVVISMRTDFLGATSQFTGLAEAINRGLYLTPRLSRNQLYEAITKPALRFDGEVEERLAKHLLNEAGSNPDQLPLLQHSLMRHWEDDEDKVLTYREHIALGGLQSCLNEHLEEAWKELNSKQQIKAEIVFKALVQVTQNGHFIRRPERFSELMLLTELSEKEVSEILSVFEKGKRNFLVRIEMPRKQQGDQQIIDISHESLIRQWDRLKQWATEEVTKEETYTRLQNATYRHLQGDGELWRGADLAMAREWLNNTQPNELWSDRYRIKFTAHSKSRILEGKAPSFKDVEFFIERSIEKEDVEILEKEELQKEKEKRQKEKEKQQKNQINNLYKTIILTFLALLVSLAVLIFGYNQWQRSKKLGDELTNTNTYLNDAIDESVKLKELAEKQSKDKQKLVVKYQEGLFSSYLSSASLNAKLGKYKAAFELLNESKKLQNKNNKISNEFLIDQIQINARNLLLGFVKIMGGNSERIVLKSEGRHFNDLSLSRDGLWLAAGGDTGTLLLKQLSFNDEYLADTESLSHSKVTSVIFDPNHMWLYTAEEGDSIKKWDYSKLLGNKLIIDDSWLTNQRRISSMAITPDGTTLVVGSGYNGGKKRSIKLYNTVTKEVIKNLYGHKDSVVARGLTVSSSGKFLASASLDDEVGVWDMSRKKLYRLFPGYSSNPSGLAFSPDSKLLAIGAKNKIEIMHIGRRKLLNRFDGHKNTVFDLEFYRHQTSDYPHTTLPERTMLASASRDKTIRLWDVDSGVTVRVLEGHKEDVVALSMNEEDGKLYSASHDGTVREWSVRLPNQWDIRISSAATSSALTSDGKFIFTGLKSGQIYSYRLADLVPIDKSNVPQKPAIKRIILNKTNDILISLDAASIITLWKVKNGHLLSKKKYPVAKTSVTSIDLSPDDHSLVVSYLNGQVSILNIDTKVMGEPVVVHDGGVAAIGFNTSGNTILTSGKSDKLLKHWKIEATKLVQEGKDIPFDEEINSVAISKNDKKIVTLGKDLVIKVRPHPFTDANDYISLDGHQNKIYQAIFSPDSHQLATLSKDRTVRVWDLATNNELFKIDLPVKDDAKFSQFNFECTKTGCWIAVPYSDSNTVGGVLLYNLGKIDY